MTRPTLSLSGPFSNEGAVLMATEWERRMKNEGLDPVRNGTDVIARRETGSVVLVHFICLPDTTDPRGKGK
jgi:hypothetical protein